MTYDEAKKALEDVGLYLNATGQRHQRHGL